MSNHNPLQQSYSWFISLSLIRHLRMTVTMYNAHLVGKLLNGSRFPGSKLAVFAFSHSLIKNLIIGVSFCECNSRFSIISATAFRFCSQLLRALQLSGFSSHSSADNFAFCTACSRTQRLVVRRSITHKNSVNSCHRRSTPWLKIVSMRRVFVWTNVFMGIFCWRCLKKAVINWCSSFSPPLMNLSDTLYLHPIPHIDSYEHQWSGLTLMNATFLSPFPSRAVERSQSIFSDIWYSFGETVSTTETALE